MPSSTEPQTTNVEGVNIVDGILQFRSDEHLKTVIESFSKTGQVGFFDNLSGFTSLREARLALSDEVYDEVGKAGKIGKYSHVLALHETDAKEMRITPMVEDAFFESVLNKDGGILIGKTAYKVQRDNVYSYNTLENKMLVKTFLSQPNQVGITQSKIERVSTPLKLETKGSPNARTDGPYYNTGGSSYRFFGEFASSNWWIYSSIGVKVGHEKASKFLWWTTWNCVSTNSIQFNYDALFIQGGIPFRRIGNAQGSYIDVVEDYVTQSVGISTYWYSGAGVAQVVGLDNSLRSFSFYP